MTRFAPALVVLLGACTMPNPAYEGGDELADDTRGNTGDSGGETSEPSDTSSATLEGSTDDASEANDTVDTTPADTSEEASDDPASCGNGITEAGEACDDGDADNTNDCLDDCTIASCGDGFIHAGVEACDDGNMDTTDDCPMCAVAACGDGFVQTEKEFCDDSNMDELDGCPASCNLDYRIVFVTSAPIGGGSIGGLAGADEHCKNLATMAGLSGNYLAWLSDGVQSPSSRFPKSTVPYKLRNGAHVAESWDDLVNGPVANAIMVNESGGDPPLTGNSQCGPMVVWTGTNNAGGSLMPNCGGFSDSNAFGWIGSAPSTEQWTACAGLQPKCDAMGALYCFQA